MYALKSNFLMVDVFLDVFALVRLIIALHVKKKIAVAKYRVNRVESIFSRHFLGKESD